MWIMKSNLDRIKVHFYVTVVFPEGCELQTLVVFDIKEHMLTNNEMLDGMYDSILLLNSPNRKSLRKVMHINEVLSTLCTVGYCSNKVLI